MSRWPTEQPAYIRSKLLESHSIDLVLDVGANNGGFGRELRDYGYNGQIVSFEPIAATRARLTRELDERWSVLPYALGDVDQVSEIHVAGNSEASSSLLEMLPSHIRAAPAAVTTRTESVEVRRLDGLWPSLPRSEETHTYLKVDTQGYELQVLKGAGHELSKVTGVGVEVSFVELYSGGPLARTVVSFLEEQGFTFMRIDPGFTDPSTGRMLQADAMFFRE